MPVYGYWFYWYVSLISKSYFYVVSCAWLVETRQVTQIWQSTSFPTYLVSLSQNESSEKTLRRYGPEAKCSQEMDKLYEALKASYFRAVNISWLSIKRDVSLKEWKAATYCSIVWWKSLNNVWEFYSANVNFRILVTPSEGNGENHKYKGRGAKKL